MAGYMRTPLAERLESRLNKSAPNGCWEYMGTRMPRGYGQIGKGGKGTGNFYAHRAAWMCWRGPIPEGMDVCHKCDNPPCCNPDHLFIGTRSDNMRDCVKKGRFVVGDRLRGTANPNTKLSEDQVREIRFIYAIGGASQSQLARQFGTGQNHVSRIIRREAWENLH